MAVAYNVVLGGYAYAFKTLKLSDVLAHFGVSEGSMEELERMFAQAYRKYYGGEASTDQLEKCNKDYTDRKALPISVLSVFCKENGLLPDEKELLAL